MDRIELSDENVVRMDAPSDGLFGLRILFVNVFLIRGDHGSWALVDAGLPLSTGRIRNWVRDHLPPTGQPHLIIQTHAHFDHTGALAELAEEWDVPVYAHRRELPYLTGRAKYPPPDPGVEGGGAMAWLSPLYPREGVDLRGRVQPLPEDGSVPGLSGWQVIPTPGHTEGHISLFREQDRALVVGDAFCTTKQESFLAVATQRPELHGPPAYYTPDWDAARASVERLAALRPYVIAPAHGQAMQGVEVADALAELAFRFDEVARPAHGKYVEPVVS